MIMWTNDQKSSINYFSDEASEIAEHVYAGKIARSKLSKEPSGKKTKSFNNHSVEKNNWHNKRRQCNKPRNDEVLAHKKRKRNDWDKNWTTKCLNQNCDGIHPILEYRITDGDIAKKLVQDLFKKRRDDKDKERT